MSTCSGEGCDHSSHKEVVDGATQEVVVSGETDSTAPVTAAPQPSKTQLKAFKKMQKQQNKAIAKMMERNAKTKEKLNKELKTLKRKVGNDSWKVLTDICTVNVPEQKNDEGVVIQEANTYVNKYALLVEAKNLLVMMRQSRIDKGLRKKTSGSSSQRRAHKSKYDFLMGRGKKAKEENTVAGEVKA